MKNESKQNHLVIDCRMLVLLPLFFIIISANEPLKLSQECKELLAPYRPWNCCEDYPMPNYNIETINDCFRKCNDKKDDHCCVLDCYHESTGIYEQEKLNMDKFVDFFVYEYDEKKQQIWSTETRKSIETCDKLSELFNYLLHRIKKIHFFTYSKVASLAGSCKYPTNLVNIATCTMQMNFINCPVFNATSECENMKTFVRSHEKCGWKNGDTFIIDPEFWYTQRTEQENATTTSKT